MALAVRKSRLLKLGLHMQIFAVVPLFALFSFAVALWHEILDDYYTKDALDGIFPRLLTVRLPAQVLDQLAPEFLQKNSVIPQFPLLAFGVSAGFSLIPLDISRRMVYNMLQEQDIISMLIDSFRSVFGSFLFSVTLLLFAITGIALSNCWRLMNRLVYPTLFCSLVERKKQSAEQAGKEPTLFHCDCEDCSSYESGKFCSRAVIALKAVHTVLPVNIATCEKVV